MEEILHKNYMETPLSIQWYETIDVDPGWPCRCYSPVIPIRMPVQFGSVFHQQQQQKDGGELPMKWCKFCIRITRKPPLHTVVWNDRFGPQTAMPLLSDSPGIPIRMPVQFGVRMLLATAAKGWRWFANEMVKSLHKNYMETPLSIQWYETMNVDPRCPCGCYQTHLWY